MEEKELFLRTLDDLYRCINSSDPYNVLRASALIRQLFLDGRNSLVDRVNRNYRHRLRFVVVEQAPPQIPGVTPTSWYAIDGIDPRRVPPNLPRVEKNRDDFFSMTVATIEDHEYSIRELVQYVGHIMGGVHSGSPKTEKEQKLSQVQNLYIFSSLPVALLFIRAIGRLILETLKPLSYDVRDLGRFENCPGISVHIALSLFPLIDKDNYILDIGKEQRRDCAYRYGDPTYLNLQVGIHEEELLLGVEAGGWFHHYVTRGTSSGFDPGQLHFVLGSDVIGKAETNTDIMEHCEYSRILKRDEQDQIRDYFQNQIAKGYQARVHFEGNMFLHSQNHPNFPNSPGRT